jgi:septal ring factor EnvC (AmiA/AmiB activator)
MTMTQWVCQLEGVTAKWPSRKITTLNNINFSSSLIEENAMLPLMGPSGQGKRKIMLINVFRQTVVFFVISISLMACAVSEDPSQGGFIDGVIGIFQGTYEERQTEMKNNLATMEQRNEKMLDEQRHLEKTRTEQKAVLVTLKTEFDVLSRKNTELSERIARIEATTASMNAGKKRLNRQVKSVQKRLNSVVRKISSVQKDMDKLKRTPSRFSKDLAVYEAEKKRLEKELRKLEEDTELLEP